MTLEEANAAALRASTAGDLEALSVALKARAEAIRALLAGEPSEEMASRIRNALNAGEFVDQDLRAIKGRITLLRSGLGASVGDPNIDVRG